MTIDIKSEPRNRSWIIFDIESAVTDESGHRRYQQMERYVPRDDDDDQLGRRGYKRAEDPLKTPRWIFQSITTASAMVLTEHPDGNADVTRFVTLSAPDHTEKQINRDEQRRKHFFEQHFFSVRRCFFVPPCDAVPSVGSVTVPS